MSELELGRDLTRLPRGPWRRAERIQQLGAIVKRVGTHSVILGSDVVVVFSCNDRVSGQLDFFEESDDNTARLLVDLTRVETR